MSQSAKDLLRRKYQEWGNYVSRGEAPRGRRRRTLTTRLVSGENVLEIGCAEGWMTRELIGSHRLVVSGDIAFTYLVRTHSNLPAARLVNFDALALPFTREFFDCVVCAEVLEHVITPFQVLLEIRRVLKPGGELVLSVPNSMTSTRYLRHLLGHALDYAKHPTNAHLSSFDPAGLSQLLSMAGFILCDIRTSYVQFPLLSRLLKNLSPDSAIHDVLCRKFRLVGQDILIKARKGQTRFWQELDQYYQRKYA